MARNTVTGTWMPASRREWLQGAGLLGGLGLMGQIPARAAVGGTPGVLRVVGSADPPYRIFEGGQAQGLYYELLRAAAGRAGWELKVQEVPAARALLMMEKGEADAMIGPLHTAERAQYLYYSRITLPPEVKAFYTRPDAAPLSVMDDLLGLRIGVQRGKRYGRPFDDDTRLLRTELTDYRSALTMVKHGRLDVVVVPERQGDRLLQDLKLDLHKQPLRLVGETPYLVVARRSPWLQRLRELERAVETLQSDGTWAAILARY
jgi:polar amino acid transport system substrate-binding protein